MYRKLLRPLIFMIGIRLLMNCSTEPEENGNNSPNYSNSDLQGLWHVNCLASGPGAPWWERGQMIVSADGSVSGSLEGSNSISYPLSGTLNISPDGIITTPVNATGQGSLDAGKTIMVFTSTWLTGYPGTTVLQVCIKMID